jgi:hypothetical protein
MQTITVYPERNPPLEEIKRFVRSFPDGEWVTASRGVVESEDGRVYLDYDEHYREYFDKYLDEQQRAELTARLGFSPTLALYVHASNAYPHSRELARAVCEALVKQWGGCWTDGSNPAFKAPDVERQPANGAALRGQKVPGTE